MSVAFVAVLATPIALAIAQPNDTAVTVVAFDTRTRHRRWQHDIDLLWEDSYSRMCSQRGSPGLGRMLVLGSEVKQHDLAP